MSSVSENIVREYFELHGFLVRQQRKYFAPGLREQEEIDFFVLNPQPRKTDAPLPMVVSSDDLYGIERAVVGIKASHTGVFSPAFLAKDAEIVRFAEPVTLRRAVRFFGVEDRIVRILVLPALPPGEEARRQSLDMLRARGIDAVIPFRTLLADLVARVEATHNYQKSDLLQTIRLLKNYEFLKEPQMELFKPRRRRAPKPPEPEKATDT